MRLTRLRLRPRDIRELTHLVVRAKSQNEDATRPLVGLALAAGVPHAKIARQAGVRVSRQTIVKWHRQALARGNGAVTVFSKPPRRGRSLTGCRRELVEWAIRELQAGGTAAEVAERTHLPLAIVKKIRSTHVPPRLRRDRGSVGPANPAARLPDPVDVAGVLVSDDVCAIAVTVPLDALRLIDMMHTIGSPSPWSQYWVEVWRLACRGDARGDLPASVRHVLSRVGDRCHNLPSRGMRWWARLRRFVRTVAAATPFSLGVMIAFAAPAPAVEPYALWSNRRVRVMTFNAAANAVGVGLLYTPPGEWLSRATDLLEHIAGRAPDRPANWRYMSDVARALPVSGGVVVVKRRTGQVVVRFERRRARR